MDKSKEEKNSEGDLPATSQHLVGNMTLSRAEKSHPADHVPLSDEQKSRQGTSSGTSAHGVFGMEIDASSCVFNGDAVGGMRQNGTEVHMVSGGSVRNKSVLFNGNLDPESFKKLFSKDR